MLELFNDTIVWTTQKYDGLDKQAIVYGILIASAIQCIIHGSFKPVRETWIGVFLLVVIFSVLSVIVFVVGSIYLKAKEYVPNLDGLLIFAPIVAGFSWYFYEVAKNIRKIWFN